MQIKNACGFFVMKKLQERRKVKIFKIVKKVLIKIKGGETNGIVEN